MKYHWRVFIECMILLCLAIAIARIGYLSDRYRMNWEALTCFQTKDVIIP